MNIFAQFHTGRTSATGITLPLAAHQIVGKSYSNGQLAVTPRAGYEQRVCQTVLVDTTAQLLYDASLPNYILEENTHQYIAFAIS